MWFCNSKLNTKQPIATGNEMNRFFRSLQYVLHRVEAARLDESPPREPVT